MNASVFRQHLRELLIEDSIGCTVYSVVRQQGIEPSDGRSEAASESHIMKARALSRHHIRVEAVTREMLVALRLEEIEAVPLKVGFQGAGHGGSSVGGSKSSVGGGVWDQLEGDLVTEEADVGYSRKIAASLSIPRPVHRSSAERNEGGTIRGRRLRRWIR
jgi:hypothetical protein